MKYTVAFVCVGNSCRSQTAERWAKHLGSDVLEVYSAGMYPALGVNQKAIEVMKEVEIDISENKTKPLEGIPDEIDILIKMECDITCPSICSTYEQDWGIKDPVGRDIEEFREVRDIIKEKVILLIEKVKDNNFDIFEKQ